MNRCHACAVAGLAACIHLGGIGFMEAAHPRREEARPALTVDALPADPDHAHRDYDRGIRVQGTEMTGSGTSSEAMPPGRFISTPQYRPRYHHPDASAYFVPVTLRSTST
jgi:hypothetical protein